MYIYVYIRVYIHIYAGRLGKGAAGKDAGKGGLGAPRAAAYYYICLLHTRVQGRGKRRARCA
jgi:hypothetical protein